MYARTVEGCLGVPVQHRTQDESPVTQHVAEDVLLMLRKLMFAVVVYPALFCKFGSFQI